MKICVYGGRDTHITLAGAKWLYDTLQELKCEDLIHGCASGIDSCAGFLAYLIGAGGAHPLRVTEFPAQWDTYGKSAGYMRNESMAGYADKGIMFPGGNGTKHMTQCLLFYRKPILNAFNEIWHMKDRSLSIMFNKDAIKEIKVWPAL